MNKELFRISAQACAKVYEKNRSYGTTQFDHYIITVKGKKYQAIIIAGTNELADNVRNLNVFFSWKGIKIGSYNEAIEIKNKVDLIRMKYAFLDGLPTIVMGHSRGGASAISYFRQFCDDTKDYCVVFAPARCLRYWCNRKMKHTFMFIDPDDPVSEILGIINFGLPICETIKAPNNHFTYDPGDHPISKWVKFTKNM